MSVVIVLDGVEVLGRFDSSYARSLVNGIRGPTIRDLNAVNVTTSPFPEGVEICCVLAFCVSEELTEECVLGIDYFARILHEFRECLSFCCFQLFILSFAASMVVSHPNDDPYSYFMNNLIYILLEMSSALYDDGHNFNCLLSSHGLDRKGCSFPDCKRAFFHHVLNGMCAYSQASGCRSVFGLSSMEIAQRTFAILSYASFSTLCIACQSLGNFIDFEHQSRTPFDVLDEYEGRLLTFTFKSVHDCLFGIAASSFEDLLILCASHALSAMGDSNKLRQDLVNHLYEGRCCVGHKLFVPPRCMKVRCELFGDGNYRGWNLFLSAFLLRLCKTSNRNYIIQVLQHYEIAYDCNSTLRSLRSHVKSFVANL
jgi:hypothetical protein